ncbi:hypothetical protein [Neptuniibacter halophilus]|uniref:hypothetical protein n=1 Tax=Neptuniibacter halophilus TaxID=651666 RepID=UPI002572F509|nr:hypothetical protein [Neptuniibacter halophilus]
MRNLLIAGAVAVAGAAGYMLIQPQSQDGAGVSPLAYVPADTVFYSGQLEPFPLKDYLRATTFASPQMSQDLLEEFDDQSSAQHRFLGSLVKAYFIAAESEERFQQTFALPDQVKGLSYAVGLMPVIRYQVTDEAAFWALFNQAEQESGFQHRAGTAGEQAYRAYRFSDEKSGRSIELILAYADGWATWTLNSALNEPADLEVALLQSAPADSLESAGVLAGIAKQHGFQSQALSYLDHRQIVTGLTSTDGNRLAKMLSRAQDQNNAGRGLEQLRTPECQSEFGAMAANWPRTVAGIRNKDDMQITPERSFMRMSMVVESNNKVVMDALTSMQGYIPEYLQKAQLFGIGLGIDMNNFSPALGAIWNDMLEPAYQCQPLRQMQTAVRQSNPAALAMFTGMAQGLKGIGLGVQDFTLDMSGPAPVMTALQGVVSVSADNPMVLFNIAQGFVPQLAQLQLPADGSALDLSDMLPLPPELDVQPMLALKGKHLVLYAGEQGEQAANQLATVEPVSNGILNFSVDYKKMLTPLLPVIEMAAEPEVAAELAVLKQLDMQVQVDLGTNPQGIEIRSEANIRPPAQQTAAQ